MLRLDKVIKPWKESAALNDHINLYGFWNETTFLTKSGDLGMVLSVPGVDYESLDHAEQEYAVKRLEAALKAFGPGFHVYQYLFKSNRPEIPFANYDDPVVEAAIDQRRQFFEAKRDHLYQIEIFYCIVLEGARSKTGVGAALARLFRDPAGAIGELKAQFTNNSMKTLLRTQIEHDLARLDQRVQAFARQLADFMQIEVLNQQGQFTFFRRLLNYDDWRIAGKPQSTQFLDYQVVNSNIEAERDHLRVGDHFVRVLTMKEAITETRPLVLDALLKIPANFYVVTEWTPLAADKARKEVNKRRRHFNMSKTGFVSQMGNDATKTNPRDVLVDESKQADIENLGDCLRALGDGQSLGDFSLTIVLYGRSKAELDQLVGEFAGVFTNADGNLFVETYNQLNAYFATVPGNYALNLRKLYLLNTNYADLSFLFTILPGEKTNAHLGTEYLAVLETDNSTPYFLNLHNGEVAHTLILGMTGSREVLFVQFPAPKRAEIRAADLHLRYRRQLPVAHDDLRRHLSERRPGGARLHHQSVFAAADQREPAISLQLLPRADRGQRAALPAGLQGRAQAVGCDRADVHAGAGPAHGLQLRQHHRRAEGAAASLDTRRAVRISLRQRRGHAFVQPLPDLQLRRLGRCARCAGAAAVLRPASGVSNEIADPTKLATFKMFLLDEAWLFIKNETIRNYVVQAQKTWRKHNAAMILATQSIKELEESGMLQIVSESCPTKIFLANPEMDRDVYREAFHLNDTELGSDRRPCSARPDAHSQGADLEEGAVERRFRLALDGDQQRPRQPQEARLLRALRHRRRAAPSRRRLSIPASHAGRVNHQPQPLRSHRMKRIKFIVIAVLARFVHRRRRRRMLGAHRAVSLAGHRSDPRQGEIHDPD